MKKAIAGWRCLGMASGVALSSCALFDSKEAFEPATDFTGTTEEFRLEFMNVPVDGEIDPAEGAPVPAVYRVGPGDVLQIEVAEVEDTAATTIVMPDGMLYYDAAPGLEAAGKTFPELEAEIAARLSDLYPEPIVVVTPVQTRSQQYSVLGQVQKPGVFGLERPTTLLDAVSRSGGIRSSQIGDRTVNLADLRRSVLLRGDKIIPVDFERLVEQGDMTQNVFLQPDDFVILPAKGGEKVYVLGNANRPGSVPYSSDLTLIKAIASAGGPAPSSYRTGLLLLRGATTPNPTVARVDLNNLLHGGGADFHLMPNDLVWIPKAPWQKLSQYARVALDSALTTIAIQQAQDSFGTGADSSGSAEVELGIASGPGGPEEP